MLQLSHLGNKIPTLDPLTIPPLIEPSARMIPEIDSSIMTSALHLSSPTALSKQWTR